MTYLASTTTQSARSARVGARRGVLAAMGDVIATAVAPSGVATLIAQINRFGADAPAALQFVQQPFPVATGILAPDVALVALTIYQRRAADGFARFHDAGSQSAIAAANQGFANPVGFVTAHIADITQTLAAYADSVGLPGPAVAVAETGTGIDTSALALAAALGLAIWLGVR